MESNRQLITNRQEIKTHNINDEQNDSLKEFELTNIQKELMSRDELIQQITPNTKQNKIFQPISLNQIDPNDFDQDEQFESNYTTQKNKEENLVEQQMGGNIINNLEYDPQGNQVKEAIENRKKFISFNLFGTIIAILLVFLFYDYKQEVSQSAYFVYLNMSILGLLFGVVQLIQEEEKFINPMVTTLNILQLNFSMFFLLCILLMGFLWSRLYKQILDDDNKSFVYFIITLFAYPVLVSLLTKISECFIPKNMKAQMKIKQYTFMSICLKYGFILLCYKSSALISIIAIRIFCKLVRFLVYPLYVKKQLSNLMYKIGVKTKEIQNWKDLEEKQKNKQQEHTTLMQHLIFYQGTDISFTIAILGFVLVFKGVIESDIIKQLLEDNAFTNFIIFSLQHKMYSCI
ncbi:hypothetical protein PPERSA_08875 [Pseudocohnilembus persalinus]|uniref:Transmembrane protein n=1 Tax=Pseudocohnilembus persalinus TaxID=266149 RepID=A0A0V0R3V9_PSEPJ|nr:hypothetical protein PPERSA_08875 [Pseudocohnilembus persalinus]|eukprot:KRX09159.1 hypothetical protein PPERSA_08875 [Pseudocohnilembus persalinus]